jgi:hypothetical protein
VQAAGAQAPALPPAQPTRETPRRDPARLLHPLLRPLLRPLLPAPTPPPRLTSCRPALPSSGDKITSVAIPATLAAISLSLVGFGVKSLLFGESGV